MHFHNMKSDKWVFREAFHWKIESSFMVIGSANEGAVRRSSNIELKHWEKQKKLSTSFGEIFSTREQFPESKLLSKVISYSWGLFWVENCRMKQLCWNSLFILALNLCSFSIHFFHLRIHLNRSVLFLFLIIFFSTINWSVFERFWIFKPLNKHWKYLKDRCQEWC